jgi:Spy/CpxP family protein refolding chaperone
MVTAKRARLTGLAILVIMFVAGALSGAATMRVVAGEEPANRRGGARQHPDLLERLELTPEQRVHVDAVLERRRGQMEEFWEQHRPALRAITDSARSELRAVLTPEQREVEQRFWEERQQYQKQREGRRTNRW